jgi:hypothetical protein
MQSILMIRGVADVEASISTSDDHMNRQMIKAELRNKIFEILK